MESKRYTYTPAASEHEPRSTTIWRLDHTFMSGGGYAFNIIPRDMLYLFLIFLGIILGISRHLNICMDQCIVEICFNDVRVRERREKE